MRERGQRGRFKPGGYTIQEWSQRQPIAPFREKERESLAEPAISKASLAIEEDPTHCPMCGIAFDDNGSRGTPPWPKPIDVGVCPPAHDLKRFVSKRGYVYFVQYGGPSGPIKIGRATNLFERFGSLRGMSPIREVTLLGYIVGASKERKLHYRFRSHHSHFEFFHPHPDLLQYITDNARKTPRPWPAGGPT